MLSSNFLTQKRTIIWMTTWAKKIIKLAVGTIYSIPKINQHKSCLKVCRYMCNVLGLAFCYALILVQKRVDYCFLYMYVENRFNPQQSIYPMSLKPFKWNPSKYKQCKNADYHIFSGMLAFNSLSQWILMLQWFCYPCIPNT